MSSRSDVRMRAGAGSITAGNALVILAAVVGVVFSFLHWYGVTAPGSATTYLNGWHGWGVPAAIIFIVAALVGLGRLVGMSVGTNAGESGMMIVLGVAAAICTIIFMVTEGSGYGAGYDKGPLYGAWVGLVCAILIAVGGLMMPRDS
jgi:hypothetical protein